MEVEETETFKDGACKGGRVAIGEEVWVAIEGIQVQRDFSILKVNSIGFQDALLYVYTWLLGLWWMVQYK